MIEPNLCNDRQHRHKHIGRIQSAAKSGLVNHIVQLQLGKIHRCHRKQEFKIREMLQIFLHRMLACIPYNLVAFDEFFFCDSLDPFCDGDQMWGRKGTHPVSLLCEYRTQELHRRTFSVCTSHMNRLMCKMWIAKQCHDRL